MRLRLNDEFHHILSTAATAHNSFVFIPFLLEIVFTRSTDRSRSSACLSHCLCLPPGLSQDVLWRTATWFCDSGEQAGCCRHACE